MQCGVYQFTFGAVFPGTRGTGFRVDELDMGKAASHEVHAVTVSILGPGRKRNIAYSHGFAYLAAECTLQAAADQRVAATRFPCGNHVPETQVEGIYIALPAPVYQVQSV